MLVLTSRSGESLILTLPEKNGLDSIEVKILDACRIGIKANEVVNIVRGELLESEAFCD